MKVLVFEWLYGGGLWVEEQMPDPNCGFQSQGRLMLSCLTQDLVAAGFEVYTLRDVRCKPIIANCRGQRVVQKKQQVKRFLKEIAPVVDFIILIAPECNWRLLHSCQWLDPWAHRIVSPDARFVQLASDKNKTADWLSAKGVSVANAFDATKSLGNERRFVIKPAQGAGSELVKLADHGTDFAALAEPDKWRIEEYVEGITASVSVLCGLSDAHFLRPTRQILDGEFGTYRTSETINCTVTVDRALKLARQTIQALPQTRGYVGIDMIIGERASVVDVNPRLTTSYCFLRQIERFNIAETMMKIATVACQQLQS